MACWRRCREQGSRRWGDSLVRSPCQAVRLSVTRVVFRPQAEDELLEVRHRSSGMTFSPIDTASITDHREPCPSCGARLGGRAGCQAVFDQLSAQAWSSTIRASSVAVMAQSRSRSPRYQCRNRMTIADVRDSGAMRSIRSSFDDGLRTSGRHMPLNTFSHATGSRRCVST